jgi:hypothetical protein
MVGWAPAAGFWFESPWDLVMICAVGLALAVGWPALTRVAAAHSARAALVLTLAVSVSLAVVWEGDDAPALAMLLALAVGFPACVVRELVRPAPRPDLVRSLTATTGGAALTAVIGVWAGVPAVATPLRDTLASGAGPDWPSGVAMAVVTGCGITGAALALAFGRAWPAGWWGPLASHRVGLAAVLAVLAGAVAGYGGGALGGLTWWVGLCLGAVAGVAPAALWLISAPAPMWRRGLGLADLALVALPVAAVAVPVWAVAMTR